MDGDGDYQARERRRRDAQLAALIADRDALDLAIRALQGLQRAHARRRAEEEEERQRREIP